MSPRVLLLTGSPAHYMAPPRLSDDQITAGPDWQDGRDVDGRDRTLVTPLGEYDVAPLLARLGPDQRPDVLVCLVDASRRNVPRNLRVFPGPKVLLVADTHHLKAPLTHMVRYATSEPFDRVVFLYDRHHAAIFHAAGLRNLYWFPGLTFPHGDDFVRQSRLQSPRAVQLAFVGQAGKLHPRRARLLGALEAAGLPIAQRALGQRDALPFYGSSLLGFNSSLNGDLNLRVFEVLASGALLVTDRLAPAAGLEHLLADGRDCLVYGDEDELVAKVSACLRDPKATARTADAGARWFLKTLGEQPRRDLFNAIAFDGRAPAPFPLPAAELSGLHFSSPRELLATVMVYEGVQELHRLDDEVRVVVDETTPDNVSRLCATLPRVRVTAVATSSRTDLLVVAAKNAEAAAGGDAAHVWCWDAAGQAELARLATLFSRQGYAAVSPELGFYARQTSGQPDPADQARQARELLERGDSARALELARAALTRDPGCFPALAVIADAALSNGGVPLAEKLLRLARSLAPGEAGLAAALAEALWRQQRFAEAEAEIADALRLDGTSLRGLLVLLRLHEAQGREREARSVFEDIAALHPNAAVSLAPPQLAARQGS